MKGKPDDLAQSWKLTGSKIRLSEFLLFLYSLAYCLKDILALSFSKQISGALCLAAGRDSGEEGGGRILSVATYGWDFRLNLEK